jgi:multidrug efflux pump
MLIGLAAKNGILIVEFINQQRAARMSFYRAILYASEIRLRPIVMTGITTAAGAVPLILSSGAGAETRMVIGVVVLAGVLSATLFTLFVVPVAYSFLAGKTGIPGARGRQLEREQHLLQENNP